MKRAQTVRSYLSTLVQRCFPVIGAEKQDTGDRDLPRWFPCRVVEHDDYGGLHHNMVSALTRIE